MLIDRYVKIASGLIAFAVVVLMKHNRDSYGRGYERGYDNGRLELISRQATH